MIDNGVWDEPCDPLGDVDACNSLFGESGSLMVRVMSMERRLYQSKGEVFTENILEWKDNKISSTQKLQDNT